MGLYTASLTYYICEMISFVWISDVNVICCWDFMVQIPFRDKIGLIGIVCFMNGPPIKLGDRPLRYEISVVVVILDHSS